MNKNIVVACVAMLMCACASENPKPAVVEYVNHLVEMYPNYRSNNIAANALNDSIANHVRPIGKPAADIAGVSFRFVQMVDNPQTGALSAIFTSTGCTSDIENPNGNPKYLMTDINIRVIGAVDATTAAQLDANRDYSISGTLHAWDAADVFGVTHKIGNAVDFGTYVLDDMVVTPTKSK